MPEPGRRPLKPLPEQLGGPVREFTEQLRAVYLDRTELNQRELAEALHLTKSPVSRYLNGQEILPAETLAALCAIAGLTPREQQRLGRLREMAVQAAERGKDAPEQDTAEQDTAGTAAVEPAGAPSPAEPRFTARVVARLRSPAGLGALAAVAVLCAGTFAVVAASDGPGGPATMTRRAADDPGSSPSCRTTRVYRVLQDGDILDAGRNDIGDVHTDDVFSLDQAPSKSPYRFRDYGHVAGSRTEGYVDQAKLKALGSRCVRESG